jgi:ribosomal peptide maturation radical SAM protein 1
MQAQAPLKIVLVNMPFASLALPSLALTQLSSVLQGRFGGRIDVETLYLNFEFARYFDNLDHYNHSLSGQGFMTGVGDWFFRQAAFPEAPDNRETYFGRFYFENDDATRELRQALTEKRTGLEACLDELIDRHELAGADVVGFTTLFSQTVASLAMARRLKGANPTCLTVLGGAACEGEMGRELSRQAAAIDYVFSGPSLVSFPNFVQACLDGDRAACDRIPGVFSRRNSGPRQETAQAPAVLVGEELDINVNIQLDYGPFLDAFERAFPAREAKPVLLFETSRGCSWAERSPCSFCGLTGLRQHYHALSAPNALAQIRSLFRWLPRCQSFIAVDTILPRDYLKSVFPVLNAPPAMKMMYEVRPDLTAEELATLLAGGVTAIQPGIEALSTATLKLMRKGTTAFRNLRFLKDCSRHGIALDWNLLLFSPGEPEATLEKVCARPALAGAPASAHRRLPDHVRAPQPLRARSRGLRVGPAPPGLLCADVSFPGRRSGGNRPPLRRSECRQRPPGLLAQRTQ